MEKMIRNLSPGYYKRLCILIFTAILLSTGLCAQTEATIRGKIVDADNNRPIAFATVGLLQSSMAIHGTISDEAGSFTLSSIPPGSYELQIRSVGFKTLSKRINLNAANILDAGIFYLQDSVLHIEEAVVVGELLKAKNEGEKTIYFMNREILEASGNGPDLLRHIPGVEVDLKQNILLEGKSNILLFVNGREREKSYLNQLNPDRIARIEVLRTPPPGFDGDVSGVLNIVLKKEKEQGISGHVFSEIPVSRSIVYMFPAFSINYHSEKINLYSSYDAEINYEDIEEKTERNLKGSEPGLEITSVEYVRQKNLSHKISYGLDYFPSAKDEINYYGFFNPFSYEQDGNIQVLTPDNEIPVWSRQMEETDLNRNLFNSLYYKHKFGEKSGEISIDLSNALLSTQNSVVYMSYDGEGSGNIINYEKPVQSASSLRIDYTTDLGSKIKFRSGMKAKIVNMNDRSSGDFHYTNRIFALYTTFQFNLKNSRMKLGLRAENAESRPGGESVKSIINLLPYASLYHELKDNQKLSFSFRRSVNRPSMYLLNSYLHISDTYSIRKGNPLLEPQTITGLNLEHSLSLKSNYFSYGLFYDCRSNAIGQFNFLNDTMAVETRTGNLGSFDQAGVRISGRLSFGAFSFNPALRVYKQYYRANASAKKYGLKNSDGLVLETSFSSIFSFRKNMALSLKLQYATTKNNMQQKIFYDPIYFISLDKTFRERFKLGIVTALPFSGNFVYQGAVINNPDFYSRYTGNIDLPAIPLMFRFSYQFSTVKNKTSIQREKESLDRRRRPGL